ncbi:hypothetical protein H0H92_004800 [Tricholoma furcatifolium]|nr:hypothetical protein H0H92_004800 [Tricholoma furcatifolium]
MIMIRLLAFRRLIKSSLGSNYAKPYTELASIVIEAALPFTILSIVLLVLFGGNNIAQNLFVPLLVQVECLVPELITLHCIIRGDKEEDRERSGSGIQFAGPDVLGATENTTNPIDDDKQGRTNGTNPISDGSA